MKFAKQPYNYKTVLNYSITCLMLDAGSNPDLEAQTKLDQLFQSYLVGQSFETNLQAKKFLAKKLKQQFRTYGQVWKYLGHEISIPQSSIHIAA